MTAPLPTLLLVDDEAGIRQVMVILLKDMGYAVTTAARGDEALALYKELRPDIVISDIKMPGKDGIALLREIRTLVPDAEVLLLTGHGDMDLAVAGLRYGAGDFLNKPVSDAALEVALERAKKRISLREALRRHTEELEDMVAQRTAELLRSERFAAVGESAAALAHTIKNIAGALEGTMFVLEKGLERNKREYFEQGWQMIRADVSRLRTLAVGLLDLGKPPVLDWKPTEPAVPALQVCESLRARAQEAGVTLQCIDEAGKDAFIMPAGDVYQCLLNLAINAVESFGIQVSRMVAQEFGNAGHLKAKAEAKPVATPAGEPTGPTTPCVRITIRREKQKEGRHTIVYYIEDNGPGMADYDENARGEAFHTTKAGGSGIGLFSTRRTAREMGAELTLSNRENGGTVAALWLWEPDGP